MDGNRKKYRCRDDEIRDTISKNEAIRRIKNYGGEYDSENQNFDVYDQLLACESVAEAHAVQENQSTTMQSGTEKSGYGNWRIDGGKQTINFKLTPSRLQTLEKLKQCTHRTDPPVIAKLLESYFDGCDSDPSWWLHVAQRWPPRPIYRVIDRLVKLQTSGRMSIRNPAKYFTFLIKKRRSRKGGEYGPY